MLEDPEMTRTTLPNFRLSMRVLIALHYSFTNVISSNMMNACLISRDFFTDK
ncbi:MAG: hypothetical protein ACTSPD_20570 [Promethearchaeota archaeon]